MLKAIAILTLATLTLATPAAATPTQRDIVAYDEMMILVPNLEYLGYSRLTTVEHCAEIEKINDYTNLMTDSEFESMEFCLTEHN
jgi:hypothetical protein